MRAVKVILSVLAAVAALLLLTAVFLPSGYRVTRSIEISRPADAIFPKIADFNNWKSWSPWADIDPDSNTVVRDTPKGRGTVMTWEGPKSGSGSLTVEEIKKNSLLKSRLVFLTPHKMESADTWVLEPVKGGTKITWSNEGKLDYPVGRFFGLVLDRVIGPDYEKGLANLKKLTEQ